MRRPASSGGFFWPAKGGIELRKIEKTFRIFPRSGSISRQNHAAD